MEKQSYALGKSLWKSVAMGSGRDGEESPAVEFHNRDDATSFAAMEKRSGEIQLL